MAASGRRVSDLREKQACTAEDSATDHAARSPKLRGALGHKTEASASRTVGWS